ncbi:MAG: T9SS type A sorting domain-containing protein [Chitinophagaceae bacterium]|nr:T9SS type A sorting domain-containing protein [Chitinophagaceae bacterium]
MKKFLLLSFNVLVFALAANSQCTPTGNQTTYGTNNVWIGYVYNNLNLTTYRGYVNEGSTSSPNFDESFGGDNVTYNTTSCSVQTETFSVRYKLTKTFASGTYTFVVGGDDGYRLSLDGGSNWVINSWVDQSYATTTYTVTLNGTYNMVLDFYENGGSNRISFSVATVCSGTENTALYGSNNVWYGYIYDGINFDIYSGRVTEGIASNPNFDESFVGSNTTYTTSACAVQTETYSARYRLTKTFAAGTYMLTVGGDDGYRLSINGGATWIIDNWNLHSYTTTATSVSLNGSYNLVLEYYENTGDNRVSFNLQTLSLLPVSLEAFTAVEKNNAVELNWTIAGGSNPDIFEVERSADGNAFSAMQKIAGTVNKTTYTYTDAHPVSGVSHYRLKITDLTGVVTYSKVISVRLAVSSQQAVNIYPTVVTDNYFSIAVNKTVNKAEIIIADLSGRIIKKQSAVNITAGTPVKVSTGNIHAKGIYFVSVIINDVQSSAGKIIIQ